MDASLNFVDLVEKNPITRLSRNYNNTFINKIKNTFTESQQQLFVSSFYCYLNYNSTNDFVIDLDNIWGWLGFNQKYAAKRLLEKYFTIDRDYKLLLPQSGEQKIDGRGGHNKEIILLNVKTFKLFCIRAGTDKASEIHEYFVKLEDLLQEIVLEESNELKLQLDKKEKETKELENKIVQIEEENKKLQARTDVPVIYIYKPDARIKDNPELKIGYTTNINSRLSQYKTSNPYGKFELYVEVFNSKVGIVEKFIHHLLSKYNIGGENFKINLDEAKMIIYRIINTLKLVNITDNIERQTKLTKIFEKEMEVIENIDNKVSTREMSTQIEDEYLSIPSTSIQQTEQTQKFDKFIEEFCIVRPDVQVSAKDIVGQYRLYIKEAKKEITQAFTEYLKRRFVYDRLKIQTKDQVIYGYTGVILKEIKYNKGLIPNDEETCIFEKCVFTPSGTVLYKDIWEEYKDWKRIMKKPLNEEDESNLKKYLRSCPYLLFDVVWASGGSGQGYYGLKLKKDEPYHHKSSTGCSVYKKDLKNQILCEYETISKAAETENMCTAKMSRSIKNKVIFGSEPTQYYYEKTKPT